MTSAGDDDSPVPLQQRLRFLREPSNFPDGTAEFRVVTTHTSWVYLCGDRVYKLKKPLRYSYLDFTTVEARRLNCEAELRLNRRLAPDIYLEVIPLNVDAGGTLRLNGSGTVADWLVKMRRLPAEQEFEYLLTRGGVTQDDLHKLALTLAEFYRRAREVPIAVADYIDQFRRQIDTTEQALERFADELGGDDFTHGLNAQRTYLDNKGARLAKRVHGGRIVEGHGDLRPEHIFLTPAPQIIDCLEFSRDFRILDPADELAFLAMECERLGEPAVGPVLFDIYRETTGDDPPSELIRFYTRFRAGLWARLTILHLDRPAGQDRRSHWINKTRRYLHLMGDCL